MLLLLLLLRLLLLLLLLPLPLLLGVVILLLLLLALLALSRLAVKLPCRMRHPMRLLRPCIEGGSLFRSCHGRCRLAALEGASGSREARGGAAAAPVCRRRCSREGCSRVLTPLALRTQRSRPNHARAKHGVDCGGARHTGSLLLRNAPRGAHAARTRRSHAAGSKARQRDHCIAIGVGTCFYCFPGRPHRRSPRQVVLRPPLLRRRLQCAAHVGVLLLLLAGQSLTVALHARHAGRQQRV